MILPKGPARRVTVGRAGKDFKCILNLQTTMVIRKAANKISFEEVRFDPCELGRWSKRPHGSRRSIPVFHRRTVSSLRPDLRWSARQIAPTCLQGFPRPTAEKTRDTLIHLGIAAPAFVCPGGGVVRRLPYRTNDSPTIITPFRHEGGNRTASFDGRDLQRREPKRRCS